MRMATAISLLILFTLLVPGISASNFQEQMNNIMAGLQAQCHCVKDKLPSEVRDLVMHMGIHNGLCRFYKVRKAIQHVLSSSSAAALGSRGFNRSALPSNYDEMDFNNSVDVCVETSSSVQARQLAFCIVYQLRKSCSPEGEVNDNLNSEEYFDEDNDIESDEKKGYSTVKSTISSTENIARINFWQIKESRKSELLTTKTESVKPTTQTKTEKIASKETDFIFKKDVTRKMLDETEMKENISAVINLQNKNDSNLTEEQILTWNTLLNTTEKNFKLIKLLQNLSTTTTSKPTTHLHPKESTIISQLNPSSVRGTNKLSNNFFSANGDISYSVATLETTEKVMATQMALEKSNKPPSASDFKEIFKNTTKFAPTEANKFNATPRQENLINTGIIIKYGITKDVFQRNEDLYTTLIVNNTEKEHVHTNLKTTIDEEKQRTSTISLGIQNVASNLQEKLLSTSTKFETKNTMANQTTEAVTADKRSQTEHAETEISVEASSALPNRVTDVNTGSTGA